MTDILPIPNTTRTNPEEALDAALHLLKYPEELRELMPHVRDAVLVLCHRVLDADEEIRAHLDFMIDVADDRAELVAEIADLKHTISLFGIHVDESGSVLYVVSPGGDA